MKKLCALFICLTLLLAGCGKSDYKDYVSKLFDRYSYNFTLLLFDFDTKMLYLIEVDT